MHKGNPVKDEKKYFTTRSGDKSGTRTIESVPSLKKKPKIKKITITFRRTMFMGLLPPIWAWHLTRMQKPKGEKEPGRELRNIWKDASH